MLPAKRSSAHARAARCWLAQPERVGVVAGDAPLVGDALGPLELRRHLVLAEVGLRDRDAEAELLAGRSTRSGPGSSPRRRRPRPRRPRPSRRARWPGWWPAGSSRTGCRRWWPRTEMRQAGGQPRRAGDVEALLADLAHAAADDLADLGRVDAGALDELAFWTAASRSAGWTVDSPPPRRPTGVRTASTITTLVMPGSLRPPATPATVRCRRAPFVPLAPAARHAGHRRALAGSACGATSGGDQRPAPGRRLGAHFLGMLGTVACWAVDVPDEAPGAGRRAAAGPACASGPSVPRDAVDGRRAGRPARGLGAHPPLLRALRTGDGAPCRASGRCGARLRAAGLPPAGAGGHHPRAPPRDGREALLARGVQFPRADVLVPGRLRRARRDARGGGAARGARGGRRAGRRACATGLASRGRSRTRS